MEKSRKTARRRAKAPKRRTPDRTNLHWSADAYAAHLGAAKPA